MGQRFQIKMRELKINEIVLFQNRIYRIELGKIKGNRVILKLLNERELSQCIIKEIKK